MQKFIVEGWSKESYEEALFIAMSRAAETMSHLHNAHVSIKKLEEVEDKGFHALLEIETEPMGLHERFEMMDQFKEVTRAHTINFRIMHQAEHDHLHHVIADHFSKVGLANPERFLPDLLMVPLTEADIDNQAIEKALKRRGIEPR